MRKLKHEEIERPSLDELHLKERHPIAVLLENIRSAQNVGSILRTADAVRAASVTMAGVTPDGSHKGVHKSALGAQDAVPWDVAPSAILVAESARKSGITLIALEITDEPTRLADISDEIFPALLMVGNELSGLSSELVDLADYALEIPQYGFKQSLNVSVATGIALYGLLDLYLTDPVG
ncbi:MAG: TrmH family RNA methyltransferase [Rhodothermia bacterium]|nr:MAG: TrmH family RNA methyltransferase [Rhodothermia bacterium]